MLKDTNRAAPVVTDRHAPLYRSLSIAFARDHAGEASSPRVSGTAAVSALAGTPFAADRRFAEHAAPRRSLAGPKPPA